MALERSTQTSTHEITLHKHVHQHLSPATDLPSPSFPALRWQYTKEPSDEAHAQDQSSTKQALHPSSKYCQPQTATATSAYQPRSEVEIGLPKPKIKRHSGPPV